MVRKKYRLEQRYDHRDGKDGVENWRLIKEYDNWEILKLFCGHGYRIVDNRNGKVIYEVDDNKNK